jgi:hypothetical protein
MRYQCTNHSDHIDNTTNTTRIDRHITASKEPFDSIVATTALIATTVGIYELSVINPRTCLVAIWQFV